MIVNGHTRSHKLLETQREAIAQFLLHPLSLFFDHVVGRNTHLVACTNGNYLGRLLQMGRYGCFHFVYLYRLLKSHDIVTSSGEVNSRVQSQCKERYDTNDNKYTDAGKYSLALIDKLEIVVSKHESREVRFERQVQPFAFLHTVFVQHTREEYRR